MRAPIFGLLCLLGAFAWAGLTFYVLLFAGSGDGAGGSSAAGWARVLFYLPSVYLLVLFVCSWRTVRGPVLMAGAVVAYAVLAAFSILFFCQGQIGLVIPLPFIAFGIGAYRLLFRKGQHA